VLVFTVDFHILYISVLAGSKKKGRLFAVYLGMCDILRKFRKRALEWTLKYTVLKFHDNECVSMKQRLD